MVGKRRTTGTNRDLLLIRQQNASEKSIGWCKVCFSSVTCNYKCFQQRLVLSLLGQRCRVNTIFTSLPFHPKYQLRKFAWLTNQKDYKWSQNNIFSHMRFSHSAKMPGFSFLFKKKCFVGPSMYLEGDKTRQRQCGLSKWHQYLARGGGHYYFLQWSSAKTRRHLG